MHSTSQVKKGNRRSIIGRLLSSPARIVRIIVTYGLERDTILRSLKTTLIVGSILGLINHGSALLAGRLTPDQLASLLITYLVPFSVTTYGQIQGKRQRDLIHQKQKSAEI